MGFHLLLLTLLHSEAQLSDSWAEDAQLSVSLNVCFITELDGGLASCGDKQYRYFFFLLACLLHSITPQASYEIL